MSIIVTVNALCFLEWATQGLAEMIREIRNSPRNTRRSRTEFATLPSLIEHIRNGTDGMALVDELAERNKQATKWFGELLDLVYAEDPDDDDTRAEVRGSSVILFRLKSAA